MAGACPPEPVDSDDSDAAAPLDAAAALEEPVGAAAGAEADADAGDGGGAEWLGSPPSPVGALARRLDELADVPPLAVWAVWAAWAEAVPAGTERSSLDAAPGRSAGNRGEEDTDTLPADEALGDEAVAVAGTDAARSEPAVGAVSIPGNIGPSPARGRATPPAAPGSTAATPRSAVAR